MQPHSLRRIAPFILMAMLLHGALLFGFHAPTKLFLGVPKQTLEVYLSDFPTPAPNHIQQPIQKNVHHPAKVNPAIMEGAALSATPPVEPISVDPLLIHDAQPDTDQLLKSAKNIAQEEARLTERGVDAQKKRQLDTPIAALKKELLQPYKELRLANGKLKITNEDGSVYCMQTAAPYFAHDLPSLFKTIGTCSE